MIKYAARKILLAVPLLIGVVSMIFFLLEYAPGSAIDRYITPDMSPEVRENMVARYGLDQPRAYRYVLMLWRLGQLDFGVSMTKDQPVQIGRAHV